MPSRTRRRVVAGVAAGLAGCLSGLDPGAGDGDSPTETTHEFPPPVPTAESPTDPDPMPTSPDWPVLGADATRHGSLAERAVPTGPQTHWSFYTNTSPPVVAGDRLYTVENNREQRLVARDARTARVEWATELGGEAAATPTVADGTVYVQRYTALEAYDATTGQRRWRTDVGGGAPTAPAVVDGVAYAAQGQHQSPTSVVAVAADGTERWTTEFDGEDATAAAVGEDLVALVVDGDLVGLGRDGEKRWLVELDDAGATPVIDGDTVVVAGGEVVHALAVSDGAERWHGSIDGPVGHQGGVAVDADHVAVAYEGGVALLDRPTGAVRWTADTGGPMVPPSLGSGAVYVGGAGFDERSVAALAREDGSRTWSFDTERKTRSDVVVGGVQGPPTLVAGGLHVVAADGWYAVGRGG